jgi:DNA-binding NtrC family response regulator
MTDMEPKHINILAIGRNEAILEVLNRLINKTWSGVSVTKDEDAIHAASKQHFDIVLFSNGITEQEKVALKDELSSYQPSLIFIQHMGGGSGLLENEIRAALDNSKK